MRKLIIALAALAVSACSSTPPAPAPSPTPGGAATSAAPAPLPQGSQPVTLNPADFSSTVDNPYFPLKPGAKWVYRETDGEGAAMRVEVTVAAETKTILGIQARIVHDVVTEKGAVVEDTYDWYAQDSAGNVWYLGEDTKEYQDGKVVSTKGTWMSGVDGAQPGIIMPANPRVGMTYRQEYYRAEAEDAATVVGVGDKVTVPYKAFDNVLTTEEYTPLEPRLRERKSYAPGVGPVRTQTISGGTTLAELIEFSG